MLLINKKEKTHATTWMKIIIIMLGEKKPMSIHLKL